MLGLKLIHVSKRDTWNESLCFWFFKWSEFGFCVIIPPPNEVGGGGCILDSPCPPVRLSVRPSVRLSVRLCRRHGFRRISQVYFGISISNFICMLMVAIGRSTLIFSDVTFKMCALWPYWIFWFPGSNFSLTLNINYKFHWRNAYLYG